MSQYQRFPAPTPSPWGGFAKKPKSRLPLVIVISVAAFLLATVGVVTAVMLLRPAPPEELAAPDALPETDLDRIAKAFEPRLEIPASVERAASLLEFRTGDGLTAQREQEQKRLVAEWLYGQEVDPQQRSRVAQALGQVSHEAGNLSQQLKRSLLRAFRRWGNTDQVHLFMEQATVFDDMVPDLLSVMEIFPTIAITNQVSKYLPTKHADAAERVLRGIGPDCAVALVPYYDSDDPLVSARVKKIYAQWNTDVSEVRLDHYIASTKGNLGGRSGWQLITNMQFDERYQPKVIDALRSYKRSRDEDWLDAALVWGDVSVLPMMQEAVQDIRLSGNPKAYKFLLKYPHETSVKVLVDMLLYDKFTRNGPLIVQTLIDLYGENLAVDFSDAVHKQVVRQYNDFGIFNRPAMKNLLETTNFDINLLVDQCLSELKLSDQSRRSFDTLGRMEIVESRRFEVAEAISDVIRSGGSFGPRAKECFLRWATPENQYIYDIINSDVFGGNDWKQALRIALQGSDNQNKILVPVARSLGDFFKGDEIVDVLVEQGEAIEDLMILMLQSDNPTELNGACQVLAVVGTQKCVAPLHKLYLKAKRLKHAGLVNSSGQAAQSIGARLGIDPLEILKEDRNDR